MEESLLNSDDAHDQQQFLQAPSFALKRWLRPDLLALFCVFAGFYFFKLSFFSLSIDDEVGALQTTSRVWILTGRWAAYFFNEYLLPQATIPFLPIALFGFFATLSYSVMLSALGVRRLGGVHLLTYPLYVAFPTWTFLAAFAANIASAGVGLLLVTLAVLQFRRGCEAATLRRSARSLLLGALYLAFAFGFYQAFGLAFLVSAIAVVLTMWLATPQRGRFLWRSTVALVVLLIGAVVLYSVVDNGVRVLFHLQDRTYLSKFIDWNTLLQSPLHTTLRVASSMLHVYGGFSDVYGLRAIAFPLLLSGGIGAMLTLPNVQPGRRAVALLLMAMMLGVPFLQHFIAGGDMPLRTLIAVPCVIWFFTLIALTTLPSRPAGVLFFVLLVGLFQILYSSTLIEASNRFARVHDQELSSAIYERIIAANPDFDTAKIYNVDFFGEKQFDTTYPRPVSSTAGFSFFEWGGGDNIRITDYMRLIGYSNLRPVSPEQRRRDRAAFESMPVWPAPDSVRTADGVTLIKLNTHSALP